jgi:formylglycine-generating enzyme required for sulfatase activity
VKLMMADVELRPLRCDSWSRWVITPMINEPDSADVSCAFRVCFVAPAFRREVPEIGVEGLRVSTKVLVSERVCKRQRTFKQKTNRGAGPGGSRLVESRRNGEGDGSEERLPETAGRLAVTLPPDSPPTASTYESGGGDGNDALVSDDLDILPRGSTIGRYLVLERLGAGAMGVVYAAYDPELDRKIALKLLRPRTGEGDQERRQARMVREAKAIAKLSHPNVVGIFDVGVHEGKVFMAMEYLAGGTLTDWMAAKKRPWRDTVKMFIEVGHGLAGAHVEGLIHRDFKPDNVLLDKNGVPKVVDFGLVRLSVGAADLTESGATVTESSGRIEAQPPSPPVFAAETALTRTGALTGTPAYMAFEQFGGKPVDARTDQFAFCVALYEALYGERPFAGNNVIALAESVMSGRVREAPKGAEVPTWLRRAVIRGLATKPEARWPSMAAIVATLGDDPAVKRGRRLVAVGVMLSVAVVAFGVRHAYERKRLELERNVSIKLHAADNALAEAFNKRTQWYGQRAAAFAAFDARRHEDGEEHWSNARSAAKEADDGFRRAIQSLEAAYAISPDTAVAERLADVVFEQLASEYLTPAERNAGLPTLDKYDIGNKRHRRFTNQVGVKIETNPAGLHATLETYADGTLRMTKPDRDLGNTPIATSLQPGSYRIVFSAPGAFTETFYPMLVSFGESALATVNAIDPKKVPANFAYVPRGPVLFGSTDEQLRTSLLETTPLRRIVVDSFLIAKYEVTFGDWIQFLKTLPRGERLRRLPKGTVEASGGLVELRELEGGHWELLLQPTTHLYRARDGEYITYLDRKTRARQDWLKFPAVGISGEDALAYLSWLDRSERVPGARLCTEYEWERAARGADGREFPHGNALERDDANFDLTYGRRKLSFGMDEVGSHPVSVSPFGVHDLAGNVWEMTRSSLSDNELIARGGCYYQFMPSERSSNRLVLGSTTRAQTLGLRVCANVTI